MDDLTLKLPLLSSDASSQSKSIPLCKGGNELDKERVENISSDQNAFLEANSVAKADSITADYKAAEEKLNQEGRQPDDAHRRVEPTSGAAAAAEDSAKKEAVKIRETYLIFKKQNSADENSDDSQAGNFSAGLDAAESQVSVSQDNMQVSNQPTSPQREAEKNVSKDATVDRKSR
ncbi:hypothetical protein BY996DRAFT_6425245 [Phakopsora pachyrhizi]|nr:hypothetical protein BY996DRAFT_6425245 [Phakopsora pachyrhizi]